MDNGIKYKYSVCFECNLIYVCFFSVIVPPKIVKASSCRDLHIMTHFNHGGGY